MKAILPGGKPRKVARAATRFPLPERGVWSSRPKSSAPPEQNSLIRPADSASAIAPRTCIRLGGRPHSAFCSGKTAWRREPLFAGFPRAGIAFMRFFHVSLYFVHPQSTCQRLREPRKSWKERCSINVHTMQSVRDCPFQALSGGSRICASLLLGFGQDSQKVASKE